MDVPGITVAVWMAYLAQREAGRLRRLVRTLRDEKNHVSGRGPRCDPSVLVSIVIPARNEAANIRAAVTHALAQQHEQLEVVVLNDGSTDETGAILEELARNEPRLRVIPGGGEALPEGWLGKPWACHRAAAAARGEWLLFIDADVRVSREAVPLAVGYAQQHGLDLLTGMGTELAVGFVEKLIQPYAFFTFAVETHWDAVNDPERKGVARGNGRFMLFRRAAYQALGGHEVVRNVILEDEVLAQKSKKAGLRCEFRFMPELFQCRMYSSPGELWRGWRKAMFEALVMASPLPWLRHRQARGLISLSLLLAKNALWFLLPYLLIAGGLAGRVPLWWSGLAAVPVMVRLAGRGVFDRQAGFSVPFGLVTHGLALPLWMLLLADSARASILGSNTWKGRKLPS